MNIIEIVNRFENQTDCIAYLERVCWEGEIPWNFTTSSLK